MTTFNLMLRLLAVLMFLAPVHVAHAVEPHEMLKDPAQEARAREISRDLRCLVCQNQSIDDSNAPLARDLRVLVRERISKGDSNKEAVDYIVSRYGDYVLLKPPFKPVTFILWFGPFLLIAIAVLVAWRFYRSLKKSPAAHAGALSTEEEKLVDELLKEDRS